MISLKDAAKLGGMLILSFCAVFICNLFLNFRIDMQAILPLLTTPAEHTYYDAQVSSVTAVCLVSGGCLLLTTVVMLAFYLRHYIAIHCKELGILKALGYSNFRIARGFWVFGLSIFLGTAFGVGLSFTLMPLFYRTMAADFLPAVPLHFHPMLVLCLILLPSALFSLLAILGAWRRLRQPPLHLLHGAPERPVASKSRTLPFLQDMRKSTIRSHKMLCFFIAFAAFCYGAMTQMSFSMKDLSSPLMAGLMLFIGIFLACTTLYIAVTTVVRSNAKVISMMCVFGYTQKECASAILSGYRPLSYLGFAFGTVYQYILLRVMVDMVFHDLAGMPAYHFDFFALAISLTSFLLLYELTMHWYGKRLRNVSLQELMSE